MSMLKYPLYDFIANVPRCQETNTLAVVLEIFESQQCDRLVILDEQQYPIGILHSVRLLPQLLSTELEGNNSSNLLNLQQPLSLLRHTIIQSLQTLPVSCQLDQLSWFLHSQQHQVDANLDWALIDTNGKFLGLLDKTRLLQCLIKQRLTLNSTEANSYSSSSQAIHGASVTKIRQTLTSDKIHKRERRRKHYKPVINKSLVQLLERLPWPLMLQTSSGEVLTQNPAWWQQLGLLKDPEGIRQQVESILATASSQKVVKVNDSEVPDYGYEGEQQKLHTPEENNIISAWNTTNYLQEPPLSATTAANRCFLDSQMGTCTCIVEVQNGQERVWQFAKIPLDNSNHRILTTEASEFNPELWLMLATDVTEQQQLCKELAAKNADLIQLNRLKDEFLACISHELKTPLTAVLGLSRLLVDRQLGELNERQARYAGLIHQSGRHLMSVVNDILDLTRMETGQMELTLSPVKIRTVCDRALAEVKAVHNQSHHASHRDQSSPLPEHHFTLSIEPGLEQIVADELRLRQMLVNLLSNAFKFTEAGGEIGLWVSRWEGWVTFTVWDTGIGIPEHQQHLIFQKFQQLENPLTRQFEGTGLGLVLTRALARLHGGDVSFLSREGKGSQFTLLLPPSPPQKIGGGERAKGRESDKSTAYAPVPQSSTPPVLSLQTHRNSLVLVVEAVARYIEDLTEQLTGLGYRVVIARSGCEAVEKARRLQPTAVFLNPLLPLLSGWDVLTLLKSDVATKHIPVVVTATGAEKEQAFAQRADGFLSLPVQHQLLAPLVESLCAIPENKQHKPDSSGTTSTFTPLRILRLVSPEWESLNISHPSLQEHRVIEVDNLDQAELLARVWQFDVMLLDAELPFAETYLQQFSQHPHLLTLPLVTCNVETTQAASQVAGLSVFPCLTPLGLDKSDDEKKPDPLLSVLQIAAGVCCPPNIFVIDLAMLPDLPDANHQRLGNYHSEKHFSINETAISDAPSPATGLKPIAIFRGAEWFQALIQYLQTAGFKAAMGRSWAELLQQIRHQSVDLLLICLGESPSQNYEYSVLNVLRQLPLKLPPILILDQRLNPVEVGSEQSVSTQVEADETLESVVGAIATQVVPRSISMEDLLDQINQVLSVNNQN